MTGYPAQYSAALQSLLPRLPWDKVEQVIEILRTARDEGRRIFVCGNGGSAATASHFACDIVKGCSYGQPKRFKIQALTDNLAAITAYSNDVSYDCVFVEQLKNFAEPGDVFLGISGSGNSPNVLRAIEYANQAGLKTIAFTGRDGGQLGKLAQLELNAPEPHMGRIEDAHMILCHVVAYYFMDSTGGCC